VESLEQLLPAATRDQLGEYWKQVAEDKLQRIADLHYDGDRSRLRAAPSAEQTEHWYSLCDELEIEPPPPLSCLVVTLSGVGKNDLKRVVGRPILGKPRGQLQAVAEECGISALGESPELRIGGPPVDNVAIDEEGSITLLRLLGFSLVIGIVLSYLSFRSIPVTIVVFMVGGVAAVTSLALPYWLGDSVDALLLSMPSLVYVLGLSGAVHIINYYRDAAETTGLRGAPEQALAHGWGPCTLAAFTTALGLLSLYASTIIPIRKFGFYAALSVMATLILLFTYLPAAIQLWPPGYHKRNRHRGEVGGLSTKVAHFWDRVGDFIIRRYAMVIVGCTLVMFVMGLGLSRIETSVQLLKLFSPQAKIIHDYEWLERHIGELVPMEVVLRVPPDKIRTPHTDEGEDAVGRAVEADGDGSTAGAGGGSVTDGREVFARSLQLSHHRHLPACLVDR